MIEEDHATADSFYGTVRTRSKNATRIRNAIRGNATLPVQSDKQQIELNWFVIIVKTFLSYIKECIGM